MPSLQLADGQKVELGATWLHGIKGHPVYDLAVHYGLMDPHTSKGGIPPHPCPPFGTKGLAVRFFNPGKVKLILDHAIVEKQ